LADAKSNPFDKATAGLAQLKELGELQEERKTAQGKVATASRELHRQLTNLAAFVATHGEQETPLADTLPAWQPSLREIGGRRSTPPGRRRRAALPPP
jgi:ABC-type phosphate transport system auxiliary subunit